MSETNGHLKKISSRTQWILYGIYLTVATLAWMQWLQYQRDRREFAIEQQRLILATKPAMKVNWTKFKQTTVPRGGHLELTYSLDRFEKCHVVTNRYISDEQMRVWWTGQYPGVYQDPGNDLQATVFIRLPEDLPPGNYFYRSFSVNTDCQPTGRSFTATGSELQFTIE